MKDTPTSAETLPTALGETLAEGTTTTMTPGEPIGARYTLGELIGRGGMGEIWLARDVRIGRDVAVKLVRGGTPHGQQLARFLREARVQGRLEHPAIVPIHDLGIDDQGQPYFAMKRVTGSTLADILEQRDEPEAVRRWPVRTLLARLVDVCHALEFAHRRDVVHRDLKPANIMLGDLGEVYVLDWGIARIVGDVAASGPVARIAHDGIETFDEAHTVDGTLLGTPGYMSPEQIRAHNVDHRTDVYALGCILYEILAGRAALPQGLPALSVTLDATAFRPRAVAPDVAPELDDACAAATDPDPARRTASAGALADAIQRYLDGDRDEAQRRALAEVAADAAIQAYELGGDAARPQAMLAAGQALSLDPTHAGAQQLIGRLLITPPKVTPPEVLAALAAARVKAGLVQVRIGIATYVAWFLFFPFVFAVDIAHPWPLIVMAGLLISNACMLGYSYYRRAAVGRLYYPIVLFQGAIIVLVSVLISPIVIAPALATTSMAVFLTHPTAYRPVMVMLIHVGALIAPLALELLHVLPRILNLGTDGILIRPWFAQMSGEVMLAIVVGGTLMQLFAAWFLVSQLRKEQEAAQLKVALYGWQLEKLLPSSTRE